MAACGICGVRGGSAFCSWGSEGLSLVSLGGIASSDKEGVGREREKRVMRLRSRRSRAGRRRVG